MVRNRVKNKIPYIRARVSHSMLGSWGKGQEVITPTLTLVDKQFKGLALHRISFLLRMVVAPVLSQPCWLRELIPVMLESFLAQQALRWGLCASKRPRQKAI